VLSGPVKTLIARGATRIPGVRRLPIFKVIAIAEIAILAREHVRQLDPHERRRLVELVRKGRGRTSRLSPSEGDELRELVAKTEPRRFAGLTADKLSPVPLPRRLVEGKRRR
jgi:hypothetical protein